MATMIENAFALWSWPLQMVKLSVDVAETMAGAQRVISARMPVIGTAMTSPLTADHGELGRMVSEKVSAFGSSGRSIAAAGDVVRKTISRNVYTMGRVGRGELLWPNDWVKIFGENLAAAAALAALPATALAPIQSGVASNDRRLRR